MRFGNCYGKDGFCGYGLMYCGFGCLSNCDVIVECGKYFKILGMICFLNIW